MMNIDRDFGKYLHEQEGFATRLERLYEEAPGMSVGRIIEWMHVAYQQGARDMAQDTVDTLGDYATALAGIPEVVHTREAAYDSARDSLMVYYTQVLDESKD